MPVLTMLLAGMTAYALSYEVVSRKKMTPVTAIGLGAFTGATCLAAYSLLFAYALPAWARA